MLTIICKSRHKADSSNLKRWASKQEWKRWGHPLLRYSVGPNKSDCTKRGQRGRGGEGPDEQLARVGQSCLHRGLVGGGGFWSHLGFCFGSVATWYLLLICVVFCDTGHNVGDTGRHFCQHSWGCVPVSAAPLFWGVRSLSLVSQLHTVSQQLWCTSDTQCPNCTQCPMQETCQDTQWTVSPQFDATVRCSNRKCSVMQESAKHCSFSQFSRIKWM